MTWHPRHLLAACAACTACAVIASGCGGSDEPEGEKLPQSSVAQLNVRLDEIQRRYDAAQEPGQQGACEDIQNDSFPEVKRILDALPEDVDGQLRDATEESFARLQQLVDEGCRDIEPTETETTPTETVPPETVPPETTPPETTPTETTPPETTPQQRRRRTTAAAMAAPNGGGNGGTTRAAAAAAAPRRPRARADGRPDRDRRPVRARPPPRRGRHVDRVPGHRHRAGAVGGDQAAGRAPRRRRGLRGPLPPRGARGRAAPAPQRRPGVRLRPRRRVAPPLHRHGVRGRALGRRHAARSEAAGIGRGDQRGPRRLPRARLRPPRRRRAPRRQARQPAAGLRVAHHQARRLRHREGSRADRDHPGRLGAGHRGLPLARAGPRRGGRAAVGHLLAGGVRLPVPGRAAAARVLVADRAGAQAAGGDGGADHRAPARGSARAGPRHPRVPGPPARGPLRQHARDGRGAGLGPERRRHGRHPDAGRRRHRHRGAGRHPRDRAHPGHPARPDPRPHSPARLPP